MKTTLQVGFIAVAALCLMVLDVNAFQVTYEVNEVGGSGLFDGEAPFELNKRVESQLGTYQFSGSVLPDRVGLIGVSTGFRAAVSRFIPGFSPEPGAGGPIGGGGGELPDDDPGFGGGGPDDFLSTQWTDVTIETSATGVYQTLANINGLSSTNDIGFVQFDWLVTGTSNHFLDGLGGSVSVNDAVSVATIRPADDLSVPDTFRHDSSQGSPDSINELSEANLQIESFLVPFDFGQLSPGEIPQIEVNFELFVATRLDITNLDDEGNFEALFDADFTNTATLTNVTVLDANENEITGASVVDSVTGEILSVPEPSSLALLALIGCAGSIRRRR